MQSDDQKAAESDKTTAHARKRRLALQIALDAALAQRLRLWGSQIADVDVDPPAIPGTRTTASRRLHAG
jgi:hypothetical protein